MNHFRVLVFATALIHFIPTSAPAQFGPFIGTSPDDSSSVPEALAVDLIETTAVSPRSTSADQFARIFSTELRDIEERQSEIIESLESLPKFYQAMTAPYYFGYHSGSSRQRPLWVQIDLGDNIAPDALALIPVTIQQEGETKVGYGFPRSFRIDISNDPNFENYETMVEVRSRPQERIGPKQAPFYTSVSGYSGRYIRLTATNLWKAGDGTSVEALALNELMVFKGDRNVALNRPVKALDSEELSSRWSRRYLTDGVTSLGVPVLAAESPTKGFRVDTGEKETQSTWVQVDLEESIPISEVRLILANTDDVVPNPSYRFPYNLKIEVSDSPDMREAELIGKPSASQISYIGENPLIISVKDGYGRYLRITAESSKPAVMEFELAELQVISEERNVALGKTVTAPASAESNQWSRQFLVDGYSSRRRLATEHEWLKALSERTQLIIEWRQKEKKRIEVVDETVKKGMMWTGGGLAGILGLVIIGLRRSRIKRRSDIEALRQQIASDLHDDIGSNLSSIALLAELGHDEAEEPELSREEFEEIKKTADKTIESMRDIVWLIRPGEETWKQMLSRFRETAATLLRAHEYQFNAEGSVNDEKLPLDFKRDLFLIYKEVLNNIVKHADAKNVDILVDTRKGKLTLKIKDDGKGFNNLEEEFREGNGLRNLRMRAQHLGASINVKSALGEGTRIKLTATMP